MKQSPANITAVVVTHNRPEELRLVVQALQKQTHSLTNILILDNASTIPAQQTLADLPFVEVIRSAVNCGGAGGFALGIETALNHTPEWLWLMDDDAVPEPDALEKLLEELPALTEKSTQLGSLCCAVYEFNTLAPMHRRKFFMSFAWERVVSLNQYSAGPVQIDTGSFVGCLLNAQAVKNIGLPNADFFLAYDDTEYFLRLGNAGYSSWLIPSSKIDHLRSATARLRSNHFGCKHFYNIRNRLVVCRQYARWKTPAACIGLVSGFMIWLSCGGAKHPKTIFLLFRAFHDGLTGKLSYVWKN